MYLYKIIQDIISPDKLPYCKITPFMYLKLTLLTLHDCYMVFKQVVSDYVCFTSLLLQPFLPQVFIPQKICRPYGSSSSSLLYLFSLSLSLFLSLSLSLSWPFCFTSLYLCFGLPCGFHILPPSVFDFTNPSYLQHLYSILTTVLI